MDRSRTSQTSRVRARIVVSGRVQGVYFRASARDVARAQRLAGWIENHLDGDVEAIVEGDRDAVQAFIAWCQQGPPGAQVNDIRVTMEPYTGEFQGFRIAR